MVPVAVEKKNRVYFRVVVSLESTDIHFNNYCVTMLLLLLDQDMTTKVVRITIYISTPLPYDYAESFIQCFSLPDDNENIL